MSSERTMIEKVGHDLQLFLLVVAFLHTTRLIRDVKINVGTCGAITLEFII